MFDVIWTDPDRELVGEHRARKELERSQKAKQKTRNSISTRSSGSSVVEKPFAFLGSIGLKRHATPSTKSRSTPASGLLAPTPDPQPKPTRISWLSSQDVKLEPTKIGPKRPASMNLSSPDALEDTTSPTSPNSVFSNVTTRSNATDKSTTTHASTASANSDGKLKSSIVQKLGSSSFISVSTKVTVASLTPLDSDFPVSEVHIFSAANSIRETSVSPPRISPRSPKRTRSPSPEPSTPTCRHSHKTMAIHPLSPTWNYGINNVDAWKPPEEWACSSNADTCDDIPELTEGSSIDEDETVLPADLTMVQLEIQHMAFAKPETILEKLKSKYSDVVQDPNWYKEMELEKKRWMLSALHNIIPKVEGSSEKKVVETRPSTLRNSKILALYESLATTSYLAALYSNRRIYHLSPQPLSHSLFPNVHPIVVPTVSVSAFPVVPQLFGAVHCLALPSLVSSSEIPRMLQNIHRCMVPGGVFHLTLIDPMPSAGTLGPRMRSWLEDGLILNLERKFRCTNPSRLFPLWLEDASLRGEGSTLIRARFFAIPPKSVLNSGPDAIVNQARDDSEMKTEVCSLVGRMLWKEIWGIFVTAQEWWWDIPEIVDECLQLGTFWETHLVEAVKR